MNSTGITKATCFGLDSLRFELTPPVVITAIVVSVCHALFSIIAIFGNGLLLYVLARKPQLQCPSNVLIASLSMTDFIVGLVVQPLCVLSRAFELRKSHLCEVKLVYSYFGILCSGASYLNITLISIDRWYAVCYPFQYVAKATINKYITVVMIVWLSWAAITVFPFTGVISPRVYSVVLGLTCLLGITIISVCYYSIHKVAKAHKRSISVQVARGDSSCDARVDRQKEQQKSNTSAILIVVLLLCYLPNVTCVVLEIFIPNSLLLSYVVMRWTSLLMFINSSLNPILYSIKTKDIRLAISRLVRQRIGQFQLRIFPM